MGVHLVLGRPPTSGVDWSISLLPGGRTGRFPYFDTHPQLGLGRRHTGMPENHSSLLHNNFLRNRRLLVYEKCGQAIAPEELAQKLPAGHFQASIASDVEQESDRRLR